MPGKPYQSILIPYENEILNLRKQRPPVALRRLQMICPSQFLTVEDIAKRLGMKVSWGYSHSDDLDVFWLGKYLRFWWERILERLERLGQQPNDLK